MRTKQLILLPLFLCGIFFFRIFSFGTSHAQAVSDQRSISSKRKLTVTEHAGKITVKESKAAGKQFVYKFKAKKGKGVRSKEVRLTVKLFLSQLLSLPKFSLPATSPLALWRETRPLSSRKHLTLSVIRV